MVESSASTEEQEPSLSTLEQRLQVSTADRDQTQLKIQKARKDLDETLRNAVKRPLMDKAEDIDKQIEKLEHDRVTNTMPLKDEKDLLKQIQKLESAKRQIDEYKTYQELSQEKKTDLQELYDWLKKCNRDISQTRTEISLHRTAARLGCSVKDLIGTQMDIPAEKLGQFIGKGGGHVKELQQKEHVHVDIASTTRTSTSSGSNSNSNSNSSSDSEYSTPQRVIRILGPSLDSLEAVEKDLERVISATEEMHDVSPDMVAYLTARGIIALSELRERHPDVYINVDRPSRKQDKGKGAAATASPPPPPPSQMRLRGLPEDIESVKRDVQASFKDVTRHVMKMTSKESSIVIGKQGTTIAKYVEMHQAAIDVERPPTQQESSSDDENESAEASPQVTVTFMGPVANVQMAVQEIEHLLANHREESQKVAVDKNVKELLKVQRGEGIQAIFKKANEACREIISPCLVQVTFSTDSSELIVKTKAMVLSKAIEIVEAEVRALEAAVVTIDVDPSIVPVLIGKGGAGVKELRKDTTKVNMDFDAESGKVVVCGLDTEETQKVVAAVHKAIEQNHVVAICQDVDEELFKLQFRSMMGSKVGKEVADLVFLKTIDDKKQIIIRGSEENIQKSSELIKQYMAENKFEEFAVTSDDIRELLRGGKQSQIAQFNDEFGVNLRVDRERSVVVARGEPEKIVPAMAAMQKYLHGGDGVSVVKVALDDQLMGVAIGRGGKTMADLESKHEGVEIAIHQGSHCFILRGPDQAVEDCRKEIMRLVATARVTERIAITSMHYGVLNKMARSIMRLASVQVSVTEDEVTIRGIRSDVQYAIGLVNEKISGIYESRLPLDLHFDKVEAACRDQSHLSRIEISSSTKINLDEASRSIVFTGPNINKVKAAKMEAVKLLAFLLPSSTFACVELPIVAVATVGNASSLIEVATESGAELVSLDRDIHAVLVAATDEKKVSAVVDMLKSKIAGTDDLVSTIQLDLSEDWLVSHIIGKGGSHIRSLRKRTRCNMEVDSKSCKITISADDSERVTEGRAVLDKLIDEERSKCVMIEMPNNGAVSAFMGRKGTHVREFQELHGVDVQVLRNKDSTLRITGEVEAVVAAKAAAEDWIAAREEAREKNAAEREERLAAARAERLEKSRQAEAGEEDPAKEDVGEALKEGLAKNATKVEAEKEETKPVRTAPPPADFGAGSFPSLPTCVDGSSTGSPTTTIIQRGASAWSSIVRKGSKDNLDDSPAATTAVEAMEEVTVAASQSWDTTSVVSHDRASSDDGGAEDANAVEEDVNNDNGHDDEDLKALNALEEQVRSEVKQEMAAISAIADSSSSSK